MASIALQSGCPLEALSHAHPGLGEGPLSAAPELIPPAPAANFARSETFRPLPSAAWRRPEGTLGAALSLKASGDGRRDAYRGVTAGGELLAASFKGLQESE